MSARLLTLVLVVAVAMAAASSADTIVVDWSGGGDHLLIQSGINAASEGDTVLVMPGIYSGAGNIYLGFGGTNLVLRSSGGAGSTTIDCGTLTNGFFLCGSESAASVIEGFTITNGSASFGAGMYLVGASPTIRDCVFNRNIATDQGGGIYCTTGANPTLTGCTFSGNAAERGGAVRCELGVTPTFEDCVFSNNTAFEDGGAARLTDCSPFFTDCGFEGNSVTGSFRDAGAVSVASNASPTFSGCWFNGNSTTSLGGAVLIRGWSTPAFSECSFNANTGEYGGAVGMYTDSAPTFDTCLFYGNSSAYSGGAVVVQDGSTPSFDDCTFNANTAGLTGGALSFEYLSTPALTGCTLYGNSAPEGSGIWCDDNFNLTNSIIAFGVVGAAVHCDGDPPYITCSDIYGNAGGDWVGCLAGMDVTDNNIHADPLFCDAPSGDFTLDAASPCTAANAPSCGLVGAWDIGCDTPVKAESWGAIKAMYR